MDREEQFSFEGLERVEAKIRSAGDDCAYIALRDRTDRRNEEAVGRFDLCEQSAERYLSRVVLDPFDESSEKSGDAGSVTAAHVRGAACVWLRDTLASSTTGHEWRRFKVILYGPKGLSTVDSGTVVCRNHGWEPPHDTPSLDDRPPTTDAVAADSVARALRTISDCYREFAQILLASFSQAQGLNNTIAGRLGREVVENREQVERLLGALLEVRAQTAQDEAKARAEAERDRVRAELARKGIDQLGELGRAFLAGRAGLPEELADLAPLLTPELVECLRDPAVRSLLSKPEAQQDLVRLLRTVAAQTAGAKQEPKAAPESGPDPSSSSDSPSPQPEAVGA